jgi:hypothetical protein
MLKTGWLSAGLTAAALSTLVAASLGAGSAEAAVVYCKTAGVPQGCVVRPVVPVAPVAAVAATGIHATSVRVTRVRVANVGRVGVRPARPGTAAVRSTASAAAEPEHDPQNYALGPRPDGRGPVFMLSQEPGAGQPVTASLSGKRRGNLSLTRVPPAPETSSSSAPQRAARLRMLRKPRAAF